MQQALMRTGGSRESQKLKFVWKGDIRISWAKHVYYLIFRIILEEVIGKMQMALGVVACCSLILIIPSCGLQLLDLEEKVKLV